MNKASLARRPREDLLDRADQPGRAIADHQQRAGQPTIGEILQEVVPGVGGLAGGGGQADEGGLAPGGDAPGCKHRLGGGTGMHPEEAGVQEQVIRVASARAEIIFPTHAQLTTLAAELAEGHRLAVWLMRGCGLRIGEALAVRGDQFNGDTLRITQQLLQGAGRVYGPIKHRNPGDYRDVPVPAYVAELVKHAAPGLLFPGISRRSFERRFRLGREKAGLPPEFTPRSLRHVFASVALANGVPITDISRWLGHRNINTTYAIYGHLVPSSWDAARAVLDKEYAVWSGKRN
jgi:hypothetical protein